jgi:hypothetical protein
VHAGVCAAYDDPDKKLKWVIPDLAMVWY